MRIFLQLTCLSVAVACLTHALLKTPEPTVISTAHAMPLDFKMKPLYEPSHSEDTVPTTETLIWDCPECCDPSEGCCTGSKTLNVSGLVSGTMTELSPGNWKFTSPMPNGCYLELTVYCVQEGGPIVGLFYYVDANGTPCTGGQGITVSCDPVLITFGLIGDPCECPSTTLTVTEE